MADAGLPGLPRSAWIEVDLDALAANIATIRRLAGPGARVEPVVKADAYGHGAVPIARALVAIGVDGLCVAAWEEALELRAAGIRLPILVLYPIPPGLVSEAAGLGVSLTSGDPTHLARLLAAVASARPPLGPALQVQLEVETGLGRDGFVTASSVVEAARRIEATAGVQLAGLWTHMQEAGDRSRTAAQMARFEEAAEAVRAAGIGLPVRHAAASAGLLAGTVTAFDAVRPGIATYGLVPDELLAGPLAPAEGVAALRPILSLHARPVRVAELPSGWGISYGPTFETRRPSRIATLPIGYGDGWSRALSNRADALVRGVRAPIVGNVSMDAVMVDVTDVPGAPVTVDDEFVLIGRQGNEEIMVADLARTRQTNSNEVVTALSRRLPRVYHAAAAAVEVRTLTGGGDRGSQRALPDAG